MPPTLTPLIIVPFSITFDGSSLSIIKNCPITTITSTKLMALKPSNSLFALSRFKTLLFLPCKPESLKTCFEFFRVAVSFCDVLLLTLFVFVDDCFLFIFLLFKVSFFPLFSIFSFFLICYLSYFLTNKKNYVLKWCSNQKKSTKILADFCFLIFILLIIFLL